MAITNGYCTLAEFKAQKRIIDSVDYLDDTVIEDIITDSSRFIDSACNRTFYHRTETHLFDVPYVRNPRFAGMAQELLDQMKSGGLMAGNDLVLDDDLLTLTTLTNGDGTTISASNYILAPYNEINKRRVMLKAGSGIAWLPTSTGETRAAISVTGTWGFVNRSNTDAQSAERVRNTRAACLEIATWTYLKRLGKDQDVAQITAAGVILTASGEIPKSAWARIAGYELKGFA